MDSSPGLHGQVRLQGRAQQAISTGFPWGAAKEGKRGFCCDEEITPVKNLKHVPRETAVSWRRYETPPRSDWYLLAEKTHAE